MRFFSEGVGLRSREVVLYRELLFVPSTQYVMLELEHVFSKDISCCEEVREESAGNCPKGPCGRVDSPVAVDEAEDIGVPSVGGVRGVCGIVFGIGFKLGVGDESQSPVVETRSSAMGKVDTRCVGDTGILIGDTVTGAGVTGVPDVSHDRKECPEGIDTCSELWAPSKYRTDGGHVIRGSNGLSAEETQSNS